MEEFRFLGWLKLGAESILHAGMKGENFNTDSLNQQPSTINQQLERSDIPLFRKSSRPGRRTGRD